MPQTCLDWGQPLTPPPSKIFRIQAEKSALSNLDSGYTAPSPPQSKYEQILLRDGFPNHQII